MRDETDARNKLGDLSAKVRNVVDAHLAEVRLGIFGLFFASLLSSVALSRGVRRYTNPSQIPSAFFRQGKRRPKLRAIPVDFDAGVGRVDLLCYHMPYARSLLMAKPNAILRAAQANGERHSAPRTASHLEEGAGISFGLLRCRVFGVVGNGRADGGVWMSRALSLHDPQEIELNLLGIDPGSEDGTTPSAAVVSLKLPAERVRKISGSGNVQAEKTWSTWFWTQRQRLLQIVEPIRRALGRRSPQPREFATAAVRAGALRAAGEAEGFGLCDFEIPSLGTREWGGTEHPDAMVRASREEEIEALILDVSIAQEERDRELERKRKAATEGSPSLPPGEEGRRVDASLAASVAAAAAARAVSHGAKSAFGATYAAFRWARDKRSR